MSYLPLRIPTTSSTIQQTVREVKFRQLQQPMPFLKLKFASTSSFSYIITLQIWLVKSTQNTVFTLPSMEPTFSSTIWQNTSMIVQCLHYISFNGTDLQSL